jgi:hypothetical protein
MKYITGVLLSVALLVACSSFAEGVPKVNPFSKTLAAVPAAELPAKAVDLVSQAKPRDRQATTINVVKAALGLNPAAAPAIVGAMARAVPEMASVAAGTAAAEQPKQAAAIAKAAAAAAPLQAGAVVKAVCRAVPNDYRSIALAVSQAVPGAGKEILNAVMAALPELKASLEAVLAGYSGNVPSVAVMLEQAARVSPATVGPQTASSPGGPAPAYPMAGALPMVRGPVAGPPYIPLTSTPTNVTSGTSGQVPGGGRNYAAP